MLKTAFVQGRLSKDEFDLRLGQAFTARTYAELDELTADIPAELTRPAPQRRRVHRPGRVRVPVMAAIGSIGLALPFVLVSRSSRPAPPVSCSVTAVSLRGPLGEGEQATVAGAQSAAGFPVLMPDATAASQANLTQVWVNDQQIALVYAKGEITITMGPALYADALAYFKTSMGAMHAGAVIGQVSGQPALVITPHTDACGTNPAWVEFDRNGIDITIVSHHYGTNTLLAVADSMKQRVPWHPGPQPTPPHGVR